jgi:hypothetical protein
MSQIVKNIALASMLASAVASCQPRQDGQNISGGNRAKFSSITMPISDKLKAYIAADKINAFSLSIVPGTCDAGITGTTVSKVASKLELTGSTIMSEKLRQGCAYTLALSLGKADATGSKLEKIYLTNDVEGKKTEVSVDKTRVPKILITAVLYVTADGKNDLKIEGQTVPVPSVTESDAEIGVDIAQNSGQTNQPTDAASLASLEKIRGKSYCRMVGTIAGPAGAKVETCLIFKDSGKGEEQDVSSGIPETIAFSYIVQGDKVTLVKTIGAATSLTDLALAADGSTLTLKEGASVFVWTRK